MWLAAEQVQSMKGKKKKNSPQMVDWMPAQLLNELLLLRGWGDGAGRGVGAERGGCKGRGGGIWLWMHSSVSRAQAAAPALTHLNTAARNVQKSHRSRSGRGKPGDGWGIWTFGREAFTAPVKCQSRRRLKNAILHIAPAPPAAAAVGRIASPSILTH